MPEQAVTDKATDCAAMGALVDEHKKFEPFVGTFKATVKMWMGPGEPMVSTGVMRNSMVLGGRYVQQQYKGDPMPGYDAFPNFEGIGYWGYNTVTREYEGSWMDTACTFMQNDRGSVDAAGKVWTMKGKMASPQGGGMLEKRSVITLVDRNRHRMEMFMTMPGAPGEMKTMEIDYVRQG